MKIEINNSKDIDTNTLSDVDAELMEASKNLHTLFAKYGRQMFLIGEMKASDITTAEQGCSFYHIADKDMVKDPDVFNKNMHKFLWRINGFLNMISNGNMFIARKPIPQPPK